MFDENVFFGDAGSQKLCNLQVKLSMLCCTKWLIQNQNSRPKLTNQSSFNRRMKNWVKSGSEVCFQLKTQNFSVKTSWILNNCKNIEIPVVEKCTKLPAMHEGCKLNK